ncbi:hypothetical protein [Thiosocius teredinicola]|uniref:hypothetical protein n=1 Tax=Thiosocius teredinicola TaxID=1973002 RepID=UPI00099121F1
MNDEQLGKIERYIDAWIGEIPFRFPCSRTETLRFYIRAGEDGPNFDQRKIVEDLAIRYEALWPTIFTKLGEMRSENAGAISETMPKPRLLLTIPGIFESEICDFELGYEFEDEEAEGAGYFLGFSEWALKVAVRAS